MIDALRSWAEAGAIQWVARDAEALWPQALDIIERTGGRLNFNDALLVALQRNDTIGEVASFDEGFDAGSDFRRIA